jgi:hypothetical protein
VARRPIPPDVQTSVLIGSRRRCCVCYGLNRDHGIKQGQIAHLDGKNDNNDLDNLAFLCFDHHDEYDSRRSQSKGLTIHEVKRFRQDLHDVIERAWNQPVSIGDGPVRSRGDVSGHYIRDGDFSSAELQVSSLSNGNVRVTGLALWGKNREFGPNLGELDFEAEVTNGRVVYTDKSVRDYRLELQFNGDRLVAAENSLGPFGANVSFEGEYRRID